MTDLLWFCLRCPVTTHLVTKGRSRLTRVITDTRLIGRPEGSQPECGQLAAVAVSAPPQSHRRLLSACRESNRTGEIPAAKIYELALDAFLHAGRICETFRQQYGQLLGPEDAGVLADVQVAARCAAQNGMACRLLLQGGAATASLSVHWDFSVHPRFAVVALKSDRKK